MPVPDWLARFGQRCAILPGATLSVAENGITVGWRGREVQVDADRADLTRTALWLELKPFPGQPNPDLAAAARAYTAARMVPAGFVMGFNPKVRLLLLGRSTERDALAPGQEAALLDGMVAQAAATDTVLGRPAPQSAPWPAAARATVPDPRFKAYVADALATAGIEVPELAGNRLLLQVAEQGGPVPPVSL